MNLAGQRRAKIFAALAAMAFLGLAGSPRFPCAAARTAADQAVMELAGQEAAAGSAAAGKPGPLPMAEANQVSEPGGELYDHLLRRIEGLEAEIRAWRAGQGQAKGAGPGSAPRLSGLAEAGSGVDEESAQVALDRILARKSGLLLPAWSSEIEPGLTYIHASTDRIGINGISVEFEEVGVRLLVGEIASERIRRDIFNPALSFRLGLPAELQADLYVPYRYEEEWTVTAENNERIRRADGIGDLEVGLSGQLVHEYGWVPDLLVNLRWKTRTGTDPFSSDPEEPSLGTGFHAVQGMLTMVKVQDPVAFFGGLSYTANIADSKPPVPASPGNDAPAAGIYRRIDPGDTLGLNLGLALALNLETSLNFGWEQRFVGRTQIDGRDSPGSALRVGIFRVGVTHALTRNAVLDVAVGIGLTRDAPDVQATVSVPIRLPNLSFGAGPGPAPKTLRE